MAHDHVVARLYDAFRSRDARGMQACYADDATFHDEVFDLRGAEEIGAMWTMLVDQGTDLELAVSDVEADATTGRAHWVATYTFGPSGRRVVNHIDATFTLRDDLIQEHVDSFDFWRWSRQALGPVGLTLGWTPLVRRRVRTQARHGLDRWRTTQEGTA